MAVRFRRSGTTNITDHNELLNRGIRTHSEIDTYLQELDVVRGLRPDIDTRFKELENANAIQDTTISSINTSITDINAKLAVNDTINESQNTKISNLEISFNEVVDARTEKHGVTTYDNLKSRLDSMQTEIEQLPSTISAGGGSIASYYINEVFTNLVVGSQVVTLTKGTYKPNTKELEVYRGGYRQRVGVDYLEINPTQIQFILPFQSGEIVVVRIRDRVGNILPVNIFPYTFIIDTPTVLFTIPAGFMGAGQSVEVYINNQLMAEGVDYTLTSSTDITLSGSPPIGSIVVIQVIDKNTNIEKQLEQVFISDSLKRRYDLTNFSYTPNDNQIEVYVSGARVFKDKDYIEVDSNTIEFLYDLPSNVEIWVYKENGLLDSDLNKRVKVLETKIGTVEITQVSIAGVAATQSTPYVIGLPITVSQDYMIKTPNVLRLDYQQNIWMACIQGIDYNYGVTSTEIVFKIFVNGDYIINY